MPLFWSTDKIIAGKYRLKKPIPVTIEDRQGLSSHMRMFNMTMAHESKYDDITIEALSRHLTGEGMNYNDPLMKDIKPIHEEFNKQFIEYLEETPKSKFEKLWSKKQLI